VTAGSKAQPQPLLDKRRQAFPLPDRKRFRFDEQVVINVERGFHFATVQKAVWHGQARRAPIIPLRSIGYALFRGRPGASLLYPNRKNCSCLTAETVAILSQSVKYWRAQLSPKEFWCL
jgi:hypothetical protein